MLSVTVAGDVCFRDRPDTDEASARAYLEEIQPLLDRADYRIVNLETAISENGEYIVKSGPNLNGSVKNLGFLRAGRFDAAILANNHVGDCGTVGVLETLRSLDAMGMPHFGAGATLEEAYQAHVLEKDGLRVSFIAVCENEFGLAGRETPGVAGYSLARLADAIEREKADSDFAVVIFHGGCEHNPLPSPRQRDRYRAIVRLGADAVIGMHPHCPQGYETYKGKPIAYSVGNFFFHANDAEPSWYYGMLASLSFEKGAAPALKVRPYRFDAEVTRVTPLKDDELKDFCAYLVNISLPIRDDALLEDYYKGWCMISGVPYSEMIAFDASRARDDAYRLEVKFARMRNLYSCEAHNELMTGLMRVVERGEAAFADEMAEKLRALQMK